MKAPPKESDQSFRRTVDHEILAFPPLVRGGEGGFSPLAKGGWGRSRALALAIAISVSGCEKLMQDMYDQPKYEPHEASPLFADTLSSRKPIPGTVAQSSGAFADASSGRLGASKFIGARDARPVLPTEASGRMGTRAPRVQRVNVRAEIPFPVTLQVLRRGRERYNIYCSPCHSRSGDGDGVVVRRGFPRPASYHTAALRKAPISHLYSAITHGYGVMYSYADRVPSHDRWAIAAYIRALQLSRHATLDNVPEARRPNLRRARQP